MNTQDPKYDIEDGKLVNSSTRKPIPDDEPIFILRAKDKNAVDAIEHYKTLCNNSEHRRSVAVRVWDFCGFSSENPDRMKEPDN